MVAIQHQRTGLKGRPPLRRCPDDFAVIFVEKGREACEAWYRARKTTVTRWLIESGKVDLIDKRAAYVKSMRSQGTWMTRSSRLVEHHEIKRPTIRQTIIDRRDVPLTIARHAAQHLRVVRNGGFIVSQSTNGDWRVGTRLLSAAQMLDFACDKGFEIDAALQTANGEEVEH
jgi:hypothetical protein